jgi:hypothetical protein
MPKDTPRTLFYPIYSLLCPQYSSVRLFVFYTVVNQIFEAIPYTENVFDQFRCGTITRNDYFLLPNIIINNIQ